MRADVGERVRIARGYGQMFGTPTTPRQQFPTRRGPTAASQEDGDAELLLRSKVVGASMTNPVASYYPEGKEEEARRALPA